MRPITRDGKTYSYQTVYWNNGRFYWHGTHEQLTAQEVTHFRRFQDQPPRRNETIAQFMEQHNAAWIGPEPDELQQVLWDLEQTLFDREEDAREQASA